MTGVDPILARALRSFAQGEAALASGISIETLGGGVVNRTVRVRSTVGDWVVRWAGSADAALGIDRRSELLAQRIAAAAGYAPAVVHAEAASGLLVLEQVAASPVTREAMGTSALLARLAERVRGLHALPVPERLPQVLPPRVLERYLHRPIASTSPLAHLPLGRWVEATLARYEPLGLAFCHHDLHHGNILDASPLRFVDWEYAGVGDPAFELAAIIGYHDLSTAATRSLVGAYDPGLDIERLSIARVLFDLIHALWLEAADAWSSLGSERRAVLLGRLTAAAGGRQGA